MRTITAAISQILMAMAMALKTTVIFILLITLGPAISTLIMMVSMIFWMVT
jgi:hypothetical protein